MTRPTLSVVVLSYNRPHLLAGAIESVLAQRHPDLELIVVDNLSPASGKVAEVVRRFDGVKFLPQPTNTGFATGMNVGLRAAAGEFVHLTEDDITLEPGFYDALLPHAAARPGDLFSGVIVEGDPPRCLFAGAELDIGRRFVQVPLPEPAPGATEPYRVGMLIGAMVVGSGAAFGKVGGFRDDFFVYFEDADFSWRARRAGVGLWVVPTARARHTAPASGAVRPAIEFHKVKNYLALTLLYMPWPAALWVAAKYFGYTSVRAAVRGRDPWLLARLWGWAVRHAGRYIRERREGRRHG